FTNNTKIPEFTGFLKQELENEEIQTELEHYNGRNYQSAVLYKTVLYPQHSGDIKIDPANFEAVLRVQNRAQVRSIFDDFFGSYTNVAQMLTAPGVTIYVRPLPKGKPEGFSGAVGTFKLTSSISPNSRTLEDGRSEASLKVNEALTIKIDIQGAGNMKLIKTPAVDWPEGFEPYDPKVSNNFRNTTQGASGTKSIEYLAIPRAAGQYLIPSIQFAYYDTQAGAYKTLSTPEYMVNVLRDGNSPSASSTSGLSAGGGLSGEAGHSARSAVLKEDIHHLGSDIRYIHTSEPRPSAKRSFSDSGLSARSAVFCGYLLPLIIALIVFFILRKYAKEHANEAHVRYKKANKVAQKRLRQAEKLLKANDLSHFYEELERALWQYLSDRLRIQTAELNKENIASVLQSKQVSETLISTVNEVITTTQIARYTSLSAQPAQEAEQLYNQTIDLINNLENQKL
ncbi:MAG: BatD family protein, partial [Paludibacteraceae bacterium]|nr:BatD family protein [Paludibacteraceae bacterium]